MEAMEIKLGGTATVQNISSDFFLEYYLVEDREKNFGFKIDKKENRDGKMVLCEEYVSEYITDDEDKANDVLSLLAKNMVTPTTADSVLEDLGYFD